MIRNNLPVLDQKSRWLTSILLFSQLVRWFLRAGFACRETSGITSGKLSTRWIYALISLKQFGRTNPHIFSARLSLQLPTTRRLKLLTGNSDLPRHRLSSRRFATFFTVATTSQWSRQQKQIFCFGSTATPRHN